MSNVASLENCKRLYELSGWYGDLYYTEYDVKPFKATTLVGKGDCIMTAYDAGYLLRKLPDAAVSRNFGDGELWTAWTLAGKQVWASTPEDALALLAIQLFEQGVLTKEMK